MANIFENFEPPSKKVLATPLLTYALPLNTQSVVYILLYSLKLKIWSCVLNSCSHCGNDLELSNINFSIFGMPGIIVNNVRASSLVVSDLSSETKSSRFESGY